MPGPFDFDDEPAVSRPRKGTRSLAESRQSRAAYMLLGLVFGLFGMHNFYTDRRLFGAVQLLWGVVGFGLVGTVILAIFGFLVLAPLAVWVLAEVALRHTGCDGRTMY